jgi:hypothetical protein
MMPEGNDSTVVRVPSLDKAQLIAQQAEKIRQETPPPVIPTYIFHEWPGTTPLGAMAYYLAEAENGPRLTRRAAAECLGLDPAGNAIRDHLRRARAARQGAYKKALKALGQAKTPKGVAGVR